MKHKYQVSSIKYQVSSIKYQALIATFFIMSQPIWSQNLETPGIGYANKVTQGNYTWWLLVSLP